MVSVPAGAQQVDPNMSAYGGYGYLIESTPAADVWWAEGSYKVMKDAPVPSVRKKKIQMKSAGNEWESILLCLNTKEGLEDVNISLEGLGDDFRTEIRKVAYVNVSKPTDSYAKAGLWPDPLPPYYGGESIQSGDVTPFWISVRTPKDTRAGDYHFTVKLESDKLSMVIPATLHVWNFSLPDTPEMKSLFGLSGSQMVDYHHLATTEQKEEQYDLFLKAFSDFKISPYNPFLYHNFTQTVTGVDWTGGRFDNENPHSGTYAYRVEDRSYTAAIAGTTKELIPVPAPGQYVLTGWARAEESDHQIPYGVQCYDKGGNLLRFENRYGYDYFDKDWKQFRLDIGYLDEEVKYVKVCLWACIKTPHGETVGTVWYDDLELSAEDGVNILPASDFDIDLDRIDVSLDFSGMADQAEKCFGEYHFTNFSLPVKGLGGGTYYARNKGQFEGFDEGTPEYDKLFSKYLTSLEKGLEELGIADKACIYWFDEPGEKDYDFIHETNARIKRFAPEMKPFLTENIYGQDISDVTDVSCTIWSLLNTEKIASMAANGKESWSYLCCGPRSPYITEFIDHDAINLRMWIWGSYLYNLKGVLIWETTWWNSDYASPKGYLQNPWDEAMSWAISYGIPYGMKSPWGNGDGRFFYPLNTSPNDGCKEPVIGYPVPSFRLEALRDGIEDYDYLMILKKLTDPNSPTGKTAMARKYRRLLDIPEYIISDQQTFSKDPKVILEYRAKIAEAIEALSK